jgi:hypothetical protein
LKRKLLLRRHDNAKHTPIDANDIIETARAFPDALIIPRQTDGWAHAPTSS